jgi:hypothetical protein
MFNLASKYARARKIPRIYLSANSGARIGIATELLSLFRVAWEIKDDPEKGFKYLYLSPDEYQGQAHDMFSRIFYKIEKKIKGSLDLIPSPSPSVKIQIMGG